MVFSTEKNGFSLTQLYRRSMGVEQDTPALILVRDIEQNVKNYSFEKIEFEYLFIRYLGHIYLGN